MSKAEVEKLLKKNFSDKTFDGILKCAQGDLEKCNKIDLQQWKDTAIKDVNAVAQKVKDKEMKQRQKEKNEELKRVRKVIAEKSKATAKEKQQE